MNAESLHPFYRSVIDRLNGAKISFMLGGAFALRHYTGIVRDTKDLDLFLHPGDQERAMTLFSQVPYEREFTAPHWITKIRSGDLYVDFIYGSANGIAMVDDLWFRHAAEAQIYDIAMKIIPAEEMIWSKSFIMERDRFDGADIHHLIYFRSDQLDWQRILNRFGDHWRVFLSHLILFGFAYPSFRSRVPSGVLNGLLQRLQNDRDDVAGGSPVCKGTLLARSQYDIDLQNRFLDARIKPIGTLTPAQAAQ
jgi:hypothetical protein